MNDPVRVRFAPSPTGYLHIGAARTALYNWLFARHNRGRFILRIEDTDFSRSSREMTQGILDALQWLGMDWDEGPYFQSQRLTLYREKADWLVKNKRAYYCFCRQGVSVSRENRAGDEKWRTSCPCSELDLKEAEKLIQKNIPCAVRFRTGSGKMAFKDMIHGSITKDRALIEDFVLLRSDGLPTYHLSVVVDDMDMGITHVIRGDDHISNTPKQILLYQAFGADLPRFAHQSLILGPDKKKLSKRHGVASVLEFREQGFLPLAVVNFLAQMSWSAGTEGIFPVEEIIRKFYLDRRSGGHPVFDLNKLEWLNGKVISQKTAEDLFPLVKTELEKAGLWTGVLEEDRREWFLRLLHLLKERSRRITDFVPRSRPFLTDDYPMDPKGIKKHLADDRLAVYLPVLMEDFKKIPDFTAGHIETVLRERADNEGVKAALFIHALRMIVLGMPVSPGVFEVLELIGRERTMERVERYLKTSKK
jgi:glutamyl-tRNA synthetase/nondiscriminating glutamyl-tRNA synthetase